MKTDESAKLRWADPDRLVRPAHRGAVLACLGWVLVLAGMLGTAPAAANDNRLYFECPCEFAREGDTFTMTVGLRSFRTEDSGALSVLVSAISETTGSSRYIGSAAFTDSLAAGATLEPVSVELAVAANAIPVGRHSIRLEMFENDDGRIAAPDTLYMEFPVDLGGAFRVGDRDYLKDNDGDGVGDIDERRQGTDPADPDSTPDDPVIDVLILYTQSVPELYDGDPVTRIQHQFTLANRILADSNVGLRYRPVGAVEVEIDEDAPTTHNYLDLQTREAERHGADVVVWYRPLNFVNFGTCGHAKFIGGLFDRGHFELEAEYSNYAMVHAHCGAATLAHELGHVLGLHHTYWQDSVGTFRWSRGHALDNDFGTIMSYGPREKGGGWTRIQVFSSPLGQCVGSLRQSRPCGVDRDAVDGADAVATLNAVRYQVAAFRDSHPDADGDGFVDPADDLPQDPAEWIDTDSDGVGNNRDADDDGDGVADGDDAFPLDGTETLDTDGDGVGDHGDAFPMDPAETLDTDGDGTGDNADAFPFDPAETLDTDGDGVGDNGDEFPADPFESADTDGDGIGDNADPDADADGVNDSVDPFPLDAARTDIGSYLLIGERPGDEAGHVLASSPDDSPRRFAVGVPQHDVDGREHAGAVYLVAASDLAALDAADGRADRVIDLGHVTGGANSWKLVGETVYERAGTSLAFGTGDDGRSVLLIGAPFDPDGGIVYVVSGTSLAAADAADGDTDRTIRLGSVASQAGSWKLVAEAVYDRAGDSLAAVPDTDGDGLSELLIGVHVFQEAGRENPGAAFFLSSGDLPAMDAADGATDGVIGLGNAPGQAGSWKFVGDAAESNAAYRVASVGDLNGDGATEIVVTAPYGEVAGGGAAGSAYVISTEDFGAADVSDERADHAIDLGNVASQPESWELVNGLYSDWTFRLVTSARKADSPTRWLLVGHHLVSWEDLAGADANDGAADGTVDLFRLIREPGSWYVNVSGALDSALIGDVDGSGHGYVFAMILKEPVRSGYLFSTADLPDALLETPESILHRREIERLASRRTISGIFASAISAAGKVDGDELSDILLADTQHPLDTDRRGRIYLLLGADVAAMDRVDGIQDHRLHLDNMAGDTDNDGLSNTIDRDDDGDGTPDLWDRFPLDPTEWQDADGDGVGDNTDAFPDVYSEWLDTDGDGLGDLLADNDDDGDGLADWNDQYPLDTDNDGMDNVVDTDDDGDGVPDGEDQLPLDATESVDTDGDGIGNNADTDDDGDGVADIDDALPLDARDSVDTDGDGVGDTTDAFPNDAAETADFDGDGIGDNADPDDDNDGVADADDDYPFDAGASVDTDGDGVPDSRDRYPTHPGEWQNTDNAGFGDNRDPDDDNDGVPDTEDLFPRDRTRSGLTSYRMQAVPDLWVNHHPPSVASAGDLDGDGVPELLIGVTDAPEGAAVYVVSAADLEYVDAADGARDGSALMRTTLLRPGTWKLVGPPDNPAGERVLSLGDLDGDGIAEFFVNTRSIPYGLEYVITEGLAYIVSGSDLLGADGADGAIDGVISLSHVAAQPRSWSLGGIMFGGIPAAAHPADLDGDGVAEIAVAVPGHRNANSTGVISVNSADDLTMLDALDGAVNGHIWPSNREREARWRLVGEARHDLQGTAMSMADFGGDGQADLIVGAPSHAASNLGSGVVYLLESRDLDAADLADGAADGRIGLGNVAAQPNSWRIVGDSGTSGFGSRLVTGDVDGDGRQDIVLAQAEESRQRVIRVLSGAEGNLAALDSADGASDGTISLGNISAGVNRKIRLQDSLFAWNVALTDFDADGKQDILVGFVEATGTYTMAYLIASSSLAGGSYEVYPPESAGVFARVAVGAAGDIDDDGFGDIVLAVLPRSTTGPPVAPGAVYLIMGEDLPHLDAADGRRDGRIFLDHVVRPRH